MTKKYKLAFWGDNGHHLINVVPKHSEIDLVAVGALNEQSIQIVKETYPNVFVCETYQQLLEVEGVEMVVLNSPSRDDQADQSVEALERDIHVYAEKPCAPTEEQLNKIIAASEKSKAHFHEMAGTVFSQPYWEMKKVVETGVLGDIVQVLVQKSYPYFDARPTSEKRDGGLIAQNGVHALRFVEHITGIKAVSIDAIDTNLGEVREGSDLKMASGFMGKLENGGIYSGVANYLNPKSFGSWGNEMVRIFGTNGIIEATDGGTQTKLVLNDEHKGALETTEPLKGYFECVLDHCFKGEDFPFTLEDELHPTRMVLRAKLKARNSTL